MEKLETDVLIIGSGFGAAPPALRLAKAGLKTIVLEKGHNIDPYQDFKQTSNPRYLKKYFRTLHGPEISLHYIEAKGGGSGFYEMISLRAPSFVFDARDETGQRLWPANINRKTLNPYYARAENMINVHQIRKRNLPKNGQLFGMIMKNLGYSSDRIRYAADGCMDCGRCLTGCIYAAKQSLLLNYLPDAEKAGAKIFTRTEATHIIPCQSNPFRFKIVAKKEGDKIEIKTKVLILAAGTVGTAKLLLENKSYLPGLSPATGKNITFNASVKMASLLPDWCPDGDMFAGRCHPGMYSYEFVKQDRIIISPAKAMPLQLFAQVRLSKFSDGQEGFWGPKNKELMEHLRRRILFWIAFGVVDTKAVLSLDHREPNLNIAEHARQLYDFKEKATRKLQHIIQDSGGEVLNLEFVDKGGVPYKGPHFTSSHQLSSCRMSSTRNTGVTNCNGEVWGYPGMFITDGSVLPTALLINPSLTILANAERTADFLVNKFTSK